MQYMGIRQYLAGPREGLQPVPGYRVTVGWKANGSGGQIMDGGLRTGEVASLAGVNIQTLRYYERRGLLDRPDRTIGGHRVYPPDTVALIGVIKAAQHLGFTLDEVAELLDTGRHRHRRRRGPGLKQRAATKLAEVDRKIEDLRAIRATLVAAVEAGCDSLEDCACNASCPLPIADLPLASLTRDETSWRRPALLSRQYREPRQ
jgi:MerR family transcriptional regulator, mercuric resistance operon regulatory protein